MSNPPFAYATGAPASLEDLQSHFTELITGCRLPTIRRARLSHLPAADAEDRLQGGPGRCLASVSRQVAAGGHPARGPEPHLDRRPHGPGHPPPPRWRGRCPRLHVAAVPAEGGAPPRGPGASACPAAPMRGPGGRTQVHGQGEARGAGGPHPARRGLFLRGHRQAVEPEPQRGPEAPEGGVQVAAAGRDSRPGQPESNDESGSNDLSGLQTCMPPVALSMTGT